MKFFNKLERKFGKYAIPNLTKYIIITYVIGYVLWLISSYSSVNIIYWITLDPHLILQGQVWRIFTFIFLPPQSSLLFIVFALYFYYFIGNALENEWGSFRFTLYYLLGVVGTIIAGLLTGGATNSYLNLSLCFAFAALYPNMQVLLFFFIPIKIKWLAYLDAALFAYQFLLGTWQTRAAILASLLNFLIFFGPSVLRQIRDNLRYRKQREDWRRQMRR